MLECADGAVIEAVLYRQDTLCVSSQVGCAVQCPFCASGADGLQRPLTLAELTKQVELVVGRGHPIRRLTVSGVGEPLHNFSNVTAFVDQCRASKTPASVTTSGGPLDKLASWITELPHNGLTISVHAGTQEVRRQAVPNGPPLDELFEVLYRELPTISRSRRKKTAIAYLLIEGLTDSDEQVAAFIDRMLPLREFDVWANLYALNEVPTSAFRPVGRVRYEAVYQQMLDAGLKVRMSSQARTEENGGCGTLVALRKDRTRSAARPKF